MLSCLHFASMHESRSRHIPDCFIRPFFHAFFSIIVFHLCLLYLPAQPWAMKKQLHRFSQWSRLLECLFTHFHTGFTHSCTLDTPHSQLWSRTLLRRRVLSYLITVGVIEVVINTISLSLLVSFWTRHFQCRLQLVTCVVAFQNKLCGYI